MKEFKQRFIKSAVESGNQTPISIEEVKLYVSENEIEDLPSEFEISIDHNSQRKEYKRNSLNNDFSDYEENLAQAAREGKEIPENIKKMMENDRKESDTEE